MIKVYGIKSNQEMIKVLRGHKIEMSWPTTPVLYFDV